MRIVAGEYGSRKIDAPKGNMTRPTLDKVREAVFSSLGNFFDGGVFLDLYAGSGANGLEALSRGFDQAIFVDCSKEAIQVIKKNIESLKCKDRTKVYPMNAEKALSIFAEEGFRFDLIYLDPPYAKQKNNEILNLLVERELIQKGGRVILESLKEDTFKESYGDLIFQKEKVYGISKITYYQRKAQ